MTQHQLSEVLQKALEFFSNAPFDSELQDAKAHYQKSAGVFDEEDPMVVSKLNNFADFYLFDYVLQTSNLTPFQYLVQEAPLEGVDPAVVGAMASNHKSLFVLQKNWKGTLQYVDLLCKKKYDAKDIENIEEIDPGVYFQSRFVESNGQHFWLAGSYLHPLDSNTYIDKLVKKFLKKNKPKSQPSVGRLKFCQDLFMMSQNFVKYKNAKLEDIYSYNSEILSKQNITE